MENSDWFWTSVVINGIAVVWWVVESFRIYVTRAGYYETYLQRINNSPVSAILLVASMFDIISLLALAILWLKI